MTKKSHLLISFITGGFFIIADQILKFIARTNTDLTSYLWKPFIGWEYFANPGIAFSLPFPNWLILIITPLILFLIAATVIQRKQLSILFIYGTNAIIFGALSNYIDRVLFGVTIDYIRLFTSVINLADVVIVGGVVCILTAEWSNKKSPMAG